MRALLAVLILLGSTAPSLAYHRYYRDWHRPYHHHYSYGGGCAFGACWGWGPHHGYGGWGPWGGGGYHGRGWGGWGYGPYRPWGWRWGY